MVRFYVDRIKAGKLTIEQVPAKWKKQVEKELKNKG